MNYRHIIQKIGILIILVGVCMATCLIWAFLDHEPGANKVMGAFVGSFCVCMILGGLCFWLARGATGEMYRKEALAVVGLGWFVCGLLGALPFLFAGVLETQFGNWWNIVAAGIFESISGFTATGASIFAEPEELPRAVLFWRSLTHWLGGMGIVVLFVAVLGGTGAGGKFLVTTEVTGPVPEAVRPRIRQTAILLWKIYLFISAIEFFVLWFQGMNIFESLCHTFGTVATAGFSTRNASIGSYHNFGIELTIVLFMILAGINFNLYAALLQGQWRGVLRNKELRVYLLLLLGVTVAISLDLIFNRAENFSASGAVRASGFQVVAIMTTTGYGTADFNDWPALSRWLLLVLMFIGGSAGSTSGGIKVIRIMLFVRLALHEIERTFRPHVVRPLRVNKQPVDDDLRRNVSIYVGHVLVICFTATIILMLLHNEALVADGDKLDLDTAFTAVIATVNNIGPGLNMIGPTENYAFFTAPAKLFLSLLMVLGRLEIMVVLCLFTPAFWRQD